LGRQAPASPYLQEISALLVSKMTVINFLRIGMFSRNMIQSFPGSTISAKRSSLELIVNPAALAA